MRLRDLWIRAYPRPWRDEFGQELAGILSHCKLTPALAADVLASAAGQHLRRDPWKTCAFGLVFWTALLLIAALKRLLDCRIS